MSAYSVTIGQLAAHELRLSWRDLFFLFTSGKRSRARAISILIVIAVVVAHGFAFFVISRFTAADFQVARANYLLMTGGLLLYFFLMISQAMEATTRVLYARADLELLQSSPVRLRRVFVVRLTMIALTVAAMAMLIASPFVNVAAYREGSQWLLAYGVVLATGGISAALAITLTAFLFNVVGPRRTRVAAQLVAGIVGAMFVIGLQVLAIFTSDTLSHLSVLQEDWLVAIMPDDGSVLWLPARAALGAVGPMLAMFVVALAAVVTAVAVFSERFVHYTALTANVGESGNAKTRAATTFVLRSPGQALRSKEWRLLLRDPWLISQSLMQLLYMLPPGILLWKNYGHGTHALALIIPVLVMASGQLAGGLAWLAISGEDAPDLVATAPVKPANLIRAKVEAVLGSIMIVISPFMVAFLIVSPWHALVLAIAATLSAVSATMIQLWFRAQARRAQFHRRQTSSRIASFAEAFSSIGWAGTAGLYASGSGWIAAFAGCLTLLTLAITYAAAPRAVQG